MYSRGSRDQHKTFQFMGGDAPLRDWITPYHQGGDAIRDYDPNNPFIYVLMLRNPHPKTVSPPCDVDIEAIGPQPEEEKAVPVAFDPDEERMFMVKYYCHINKALQTIGPIVVPVDTTPKDMAMGQSFMDLIVEVYQEFKHYITVKQRKAQAGADKDSSDESDDGLDFLDVDLFKK